MDLFQLQVAVLKDDQFIRVDFFYFEKVVKLVLDVILSLLVGFYFGLFFVEASYNMTNSSKMKIAGVIWIKVDLQNPLWLD
jgi:site-specific recombinase